MYFIAIFAIFAKIQYMALHYTKENCSGIVTEIGLMDEMPQDENSIETQPAPEPVKEKKKPGRKKAKLDVKQEDVMKDIRVQIPESLRILARKKSLDERTTLQGIVIKALEEYLK